MIEIANPLSKGEVSTPGGAAAPRERAAVSFAHRQTCGCDASDHSVTMGASGVRFRREDSQCAECFCPMCRDQQEAFAPWEKARALTLEKDCCCRQWWTVAHRSVGNQGAMSLFEAAMDSHDIEDIKSAWWKRVGGEGDGDAGETFRSDAKDMCCSCCVCGKDRFSVHQNKFELERAHCCCERQEQVLVDLRNVAWFKVGILGRSTCAFTWAMAILVLGSVLCGIIVDASAYRNSYYYSTYVAGVGVAIGLGACLAAAAIALLIYWGSSNKAMVRFVVDLGSSRYLTVESAIDPAHREDLFRVLVNGGAHGDEGYDRAPKGTQSGAFGTLARQVQYTSSAVYSETQSRNCCAKCVSGASYHYAVMNRSVTYVGARRQGCTSAVIRMVILLVLAGIAGGLSAVSVALSAAAGVCFLLAIFVISWWCCTRTVDLGIGALTGEAEMEATPTGYDASTNLLAVNMPGTQTTVEDALATAMFHRKLESPV